MGRKSRAISRREFLKRGALGLGAILSPSIARLSWAASKERITIYNSSVTDSLNPYNHSSSPIYGIWQHIMEPLVEVG